MVGLKKDIYYEEKKVSFKSFLNEEFEVVVPKPNNIKFKINLKQYQETLSKSILSQTKKIITQRVNGVSGNIPVFCEQLEKFFMVNSNDKKFKANEVKTREDKELCGTLFNAMINEQKQNNNKEKISYLLELKVNWELPTCVYGYKNEFGKTIILTNNH